MPSSVIQNFRYDPAERILTVAFVSGQVYDYFDVPPEVHAALQEAGSRGRYFGANIRNRFRFSRRDRGDDPEAPSGPPRDPQPALPRGPLSPVRPLTAYAPRPEPRRRVRAGGRPLRRQTEPRPG